MVASLFGLLSSVMVGITGDEAAVLNARNQPMKLAAFEGLYDGQESQKPAHEARCLRGVI
jgi:cytochrome d ubiquinol oxidase subunit I